MAVAPDDFQLLYDEDERSAIDAWRATGRPRRPSGIAGWRHRSASGAIVATLLLGMRDVLEERPREAEIVLVVEGP